MGELIIYENDMNKLKFGNFTKVSMNFFMALCYFMKNKGNTHFMISFEELRQKANYTQTERKDFMRDLDYMTDQMLEVNSTIIEKKPSGKKRIYKFDLFPTFVIDEETETLEVAVNERFTWLLNEFDHYTSIDLEEIVGFKSKYTKNLFRLIRQWKSKGELRISGTDSIQEFREKIGVKDTYSNAEMNRRCLAPSVQEINDSNCSIHHLSYELEYANKRGKPLKAIVFKWDRVLSEDTKKVKDITTESVYFTIKEALESRADITEDDIISIAKAAKKNGITDLQAKQRIYYALHKENIMNVVGYIVSLMKKFNESIESGFNQFCNFSEKSPSYPASGDKEGWAEFERQLTERSLTKYNTDDKPEKLSDVIGKEENNMKPDDVDYTVTGENGEQLIIEVNKEDDEATQERLKKLLEIMKNASDKN